MREREREREQGEYHLNRVRSILDFMSASSFPDQTTDLCHKIDSWLSVPCVFFILQFIVQT